MKRCTLCNKPYHVLPFHGCYICEDCIKQLQNPCDKKGKKITMK